MLVVTASLLLAVSGVIAVVLPITPLYVLSGVFNGYISLVNYKIEFLGEPLHGVGFEKARLLALTSIVHGFYVLASGFYLLTSTLRFKSPREPALYSSILASLTGFVLPLVLARARLHVEVDLGYIPRDLEVLTSAGLLDLGETSIAETVFAGILRVAPFILLVLTALSSTMILLYAVKYKPGSS